MTALTLQRDGLPSLGIVVGEGVPALAADLAFLQRRIENWRQCRRAPQTADDVGETQVPVFEGDQHLVVDLGDEVVASAAPCPGRRQPRPARLDLVGDEGELDTDAAEMLVILDAGHDSNGDTVERLLLPVDLQVAVNQLEEIDVHHQTHSCRTSKLVR